MGGVEDGKLVFWVDNVLLLFHLSTTSRGSWTAD